mgnify:CR=1 FL=1
MSSVSDEEFNELMKELGVPEENITSVHYKTLADYEQAEKRWGNLGEK